MGKLDTNYKLIKTIKKDGWVFIRQKGSHCQYKHPVKPGMVTVPVTKISKNIELSVMRQAGLR